MGLAIVAIPEEQDRVWKISSEKVPHLTLLFLGDENNAKLQQIVQFVEHAVQLSEHGQFYLDVERRGELGADKADVVFFSKRSWNLRWIKQFRSQLLQNQDIRTAYDSTEQFEEWTPHLTLGYPETPAKPQEGDNDYPLYSVCFDRIAVWAGNYEGPEFRLEWPDRELEGDLALAWADEQKRALVHSGQLTAPTTETVLGRGEEFLEHFGIKGMQWGQRKTETVTVGGKTKNVTPKKAAKLDAKWEKNIYSVPGAIAVHNGMAEHFNQRIGGINDKYKDTDFTKTKWDQPDSWTPREKQYMNEVDTLTTEGHRIAVKDVHGTSPTGKHRAELSPEGDRVIVHKVDEAKHAADDTTAVAVLKITRNNKGLITKAEPLEESMSDDKVNAVHGDVISHGESFVEGLIHGVVPEAAAGEAFVLAHFGIKGMKWGFRRESPSAVTPSATSRVPHGSRRKTKIDTDGGQNHPAHQDAIKVAEAKQKIKKSGAHALSNQELRDVATRIQLEEQVKGLMTRRGRKFASRQLETAGQQTVQRSIAKGIAKGAAKKGGTAALLFA